MRVCTQHPFQPFQLDFETIHPGSCCSKRLRQRQGGVDQKTGEVERACSTTLGIQVPCQRVIGDTAM